MVTLSRGGIVSRCGQSPSSPESSRALLRSPGSSHQNLSGPYKVTKDTSPNKSRCKTEKPNILPCQHFPLRKFLNPIVRVPIQDCRGNRVYFSPPIVKVLIRRACRGNRVYFSLPRVGFPIWGSPLRASGSPTLLDIIPCRSQIFKIETVSQQHVERGQQKPKSGNCCSFLVFSTVSSSATLTLQYHIYNFKRHIF